MTPALALIVAFVGVHGPDAARVDRQLAALLHHDEAVETLEVTPRQRATLIHHGSGAGAIVQHLHVAGLIVAGLEDDPAGGATLRVIVYGGDGGLAQMFETPLDAHLLEKADLEVLRSNLLPAIHQLAAKAAKAEPAVTEPPVKVEPPPVAEPPPPKAAPPPPKPAPPIAKAPARATPAKLKVVDAFADPPAPTPPPAADGPGDTDAAEIDMNPDLDADADVAGPGADAAGPEVASADELDAETGERDPDLGTVSTDDDEPAPKLGLRVAVGPSLLGRSFSPGPATIAGYSTTVVPAARFTAAAAPTDRVSIQVLAERTLGMSTTVGDDTDSTSISRWEATAGYTISRGRVDLTATGGLGHRAFVIESKDPMRSPDGRYTYLVFGLDAARAFGRVTIHTCATFLPVIAGDQPTAMAFGAARRWGLDLAVGATVGLGRLYLDATADYQRFQWSFPDAGDRGAGGAVDAYPTAALAVGARY